MAPLGEAALDMLEFAVAAREVAALAHELRDNTVEGAALEVQGLARATHALLASAQSAEVLRHRGRGNAGTQTRLRHW